MAVNRCGIVGLPNVGKSTLFNLLTHSAVPVEKYPFSTRDHHVGIVEVPDERLKRLAELVEAVEIRPAVIEFVDIAGLVEGAHKGEGLGNRFLSYIREVDCIVEVVRFFRDETVAHISATFDPVRDIEIVNLELILKDLETISKHKDRIRRLARISKEKQQELELLERLEECLNKGIPASSLGVSSPEEEGFLKELSLLSAKPFLYVANIDEEDLTKENSLINEVRAVVERMGARMVTLSAKLENELAALSEEEAEEFRQGIGLTQSGIKTLISESYSLLGLISFFTIEHRKVSCWALKRGTSAQEAAGKIHTDMAKGFICAEVISFGELEEAGSIHLARKKGLVRQEGREYLVQDGDIITFRFNV